MQIGLNPSDLFPPVPPAPKAMLGAVGVPARDIALENSDDIDDDAEGVAVREWTEEEVGVPAAEAETCAVGLLGW